MKLGEYSFTGTWHQVYKDSLPNCRLRQLRVECAC